jgi:hypothetical protein
MSTPRPSARGRGSFLSAAIASPTPKEENQEKKKSLRRKVNLELNPALYQELKRRAVDQERKLYDILDEAISSYLGKAKAS